MDMSKKTAAIQQQQQQRQELHDVNCAYGNNQSLALQSNCPRRLAAYSQHIEDQPAPTPIYPASLPSPLMTVLLKPEGGRCRQHTDHGHRKMSWAKPQANTYTGTPQLDANWAIMQIMEHVSAGDTQTWNNSQTVGPVNADDATT